MQLRELRLGEPVTLTGRVITLDATNGADDDADVEFLPDGVVRVTMEVTIAEQGPTLLTWDEMEALPVGSVILFDAQPFQLMNRHVGSSGNVYQHWLGVNTSWLNKEDVDANPPTLLWTAPEGTS